MRDICHFSPQNIRTSWPRQLQSGCCSGGLSPKFNSPPGALPLPHHDCYLNCYNKPLGTCLHAVPSLVATEGHPGKGHCILLTDVRHWTWPTQLLNDWGRGGGRSKSTGVGCHSTCSSIFQSCAVRPSSSPPLPFPCNVLLCWRVFRQGFCCSASKSGWLASKPQSIPSSSLLPHLPKAH